MNEPTKAAIMRLLVARAQEEADTTKSVNWRRRKLTEVRALRAVMKAAGWSLEGESDEQR